MERRINNIHPNWRAALRWLARLATLAILGAAVPADAALPAAASARFVFRVGYQPYFAEAWSGSLVRAQRLLTGRLPPGTDVEFSVGMTGGGALVAALRHGDLDLAYLGIAPTLTVTQDATQGDFRILAVSSVSRRLCNVIVAQPGADGSSIEASLRWLKGRQVAVPRGTCADLFLSDALERGNAQPARIIDQGFDVLATSFREHKVDAVAVWEPAASDLVRSASGVRLLDGDELDAMSATFVVVTAAFLKEHPDVVRAWLGAERAAQRILASANATTFPADALATQASGFSRETLRAVWQGPPHAGAWTSPASFPLAVTPEVASLLAGAADRMARRGALKSSQLREGSIADEAARAVLAAEATPPKTAQRGGR